MIRPILKFTPVLTLLLLVACLPANKNVQKLDLVSANVIYGSDDRLELFEADQQQVRWARSTATMIRSRNLMSRYVADDGLEYVRLFGRAFSSIIKRTYGKPLCDDTESARFADQKFISNCSGVLVAPDLILTAAHCLPHPSSCYTHSWVFDYQLSAQADKLEVAASSIYGCQEIVQRVFADPTLISEKMECFERGECSEDEAYDFSKTNEYALVRLNRPVIDRDYLPVRTAGKIDDQTELVAIGNPLGLPTKVATNGHIRPYGNNFQHYFLTNLDTATGNSGSPVINVETGIVEGVLIRGEIDFVEDEASECMRDLVVDDDYGYQGEAVTRTTSIPELVELYGSDI